MPPKKTSKPKPRSSSTPTEKDILDKLTKSLMNRLWFTYASKLIDEVANICECTPDQKNALEYIHLKPNDFDIVIIR
jgi:hypothetical protein